MGSRVDAKWEALRNQGLAGAMPDMTLKWLQNNGATSSAVADAWDEMLTSKGQTEGSRNDRWFALLRSLGYEGSISDMEYDFWEGGGEFGTLGPELLTNPDFEFDLNGWTTTNWVWLGTARVGDPAESPLNQAVTTVAAGTYRIDVEIPPDNAAELDIIFDGQTLFSDVGPGTYVTNVTVAGTSATLSIVAPLNGSRPGVVDRCSVKQVT